MGLGAYPLVSLAEAREKALRNRRVARAGNDPRQTGSMDAPTFAEAARIVHELHAPAISNERYRREVSKSGGTVVASRPEAPVGRRFHR